MTAPSPLDRTVAIIILCTIGFLLLETYVLPSDTVVEVFDRYTQSTSRDKRGSPYVTKELLTYQGGRYQMPGGIIPLRYDDTIYLDKSFISHSVLAITYPYQGHFYKDSIGLINSNWILPVLMLLSALYSIGVLTGLIRRLHDPDTAHHVQLLIIVFLAVINFLWFTRY